MHAAAASVVLSAVPHQVVRRRVHPLADLVPVRDARVAGFEQGEVDVVDQGELDMAVMQFEQAVAFGEVAAPVRAELAPCRSMGPAPVCLEVAVVRVGFARLVVRENDAV